MIIINWHIIYFFFSLEMATNDHVFVIMCICLQLVNTCWDLSLTIRLLYMLMISCHLYICNVSMLCWCSSVYVFKYLCSLLLLLFLSLFMSRHVYLCFSDLLFQLTPLRFLSVMHSSAFDPIFNNKTCEKNGS